MNAKLHRDFNLLTSKFTENKLKILSLIGLVAVIFLGIVTRFIALEEGEINNFAIRDFERSLNFIKGDYLPLAGPELSNGDRLPGPFLYLFLAIPLIFEASYEAIFFYNFLLNIGSIFLVFFVARKYFGFYFALCSTSLITVNSLNVFSITNPINPAFLFIFIPLFFWALFEFTLNRKQNGLVFAVLILCLTVQIHYSAAAFILIPIVLFFVLKLTISLKTALKCVLIALFCFSPYIFYKLNYFSPDSTGLRVFNPAISFSFGSLLKMIGVQSSISRYVYVRHWSFHVLFSISLYSLFIYILTIGKRFGLENCKKEIIVFTSFYAPAFVYEIINPTTAHYWYINILIIPGVLVLSLFIVNTYKFMTSNLWKAFVSFGFLFIVCYYLMGNYFYYKGLRGEKGPILLGKSLNNTKLFYGTLMNALQLNPERFINKVYILGSRPFPLNLLNESVKYFFSRSSSTAVVDPTPSNSCYFIFDREKLGSKARGVDSQFFLQSYNLFFKDKNIKILDIKKLSIPFKKNHKVNLFVIKYVPKLNQSCYQNLFSKFVVEQELEDMLKAAKLIKVNFSKPIGFSPSKSTVILKPNLELEVLKESYVFLDYVTQSPFKLNLKINRDSTRYKLKAEIMRYHFYASRKYNLAYLDIVISRTPNKFIEKPHLDDKVRMRIIDESITPEKLYSNSFRANILPKNTLASALFFNARFSNYNQHWTKEIKLPEGFKLKQGKFYLDILWEMKKIDLSGQYYSQDSKFVAITLMPSLSEYVINWG